MALLLKLRDKIIIAIIQQAKETTNNKVELCKTLGKYSRNFSFLLKGSLSSLYALIHKACINTGGINSNRPKAASDFLGVW
jgi:hypothetical protein